MAAHPANPARRLVSKTFRAMNSEIVFQLAIDAGKPAEAQQALETAAGDLCALEARLTRFQPSSELSALNRAAGDWFSASETLFEIVRLAHAAREASSGLFDPTILNALEAAGYDRSFDEIGQGERASDQRERECGNWVSASARRHRRERGASSHEQQDAGGRIDLDPTRRAIRLEAGTRLDLGGIAKGWIVDQVIDGPLRGYTNALVSAGGDLRARGGPEPGQPWYVGIQDPRTAEPNAPDTLIAVLPLSHGALATSGALKRWWLVEGQRRHHLIDPRTGQPANEQRAGPPDTSSRAEHILTATALAPLCWRADILAKLLLLTPPEQRASLSPWGIPWAWLLVTSSGGILPAPNLKAYLDKRSESNTPA